MIISAINDNGQLLTSQKIICHETNLKQFFNKLGKPVQDVVEATSNWYWISDWFRQQGIHLTLAHSKMPKAISYAKIKRRSGQKTAPAVVAKRLSQTVWHMLVKIEPFKS